jgi:glycosyltransferase involved in cell wall biosynthesis
MLSLIRARFADRVIYQSKFIRKWWEDWYGVAKAPATVIINGVDLNMYTPNGEYDRPVDKFRLLLLEGSLADGLNSGLFYAVSLAEKLSANYPIEVLVAGKVDEATRRNLQSKVPVKFLGIIPREQVPTLARSAHLMYCAEVNPPCPNSVIESLACGLPVIGFDSGALKELVSEDAGCIVPYGANPWKLETPDIESLALGAEKILENQNQFRTSARKRAESNFGLDKMTDAYLKILLEE